MPGLRGCLVAPPLWEAKIEGVFSKAVALSLPSGLLLSVVRDEGGMEALAIWPGSGAFEGIALVANDETKGSAIAAIETACAAADIWDPRPRLAELSRAFSESYLIGGGAPGAAAAARIRAALSRVEACVQRRGGADGGGDDGSIRGSGPYGRAFAAMRKRGDFPAALVGFGPGTTPAGDDWLAGYLCAAELAGTPGSAALRDRIRSRLGLTTAAGRSLLTGALEGIPPRYLCVLVEALVAPSAELIDPALGQAPDAALVAAVESALSHGASSGRDAIDGFLSALLGLGATAWA